MTKEQAVIAVAYPLTSEHTSFDAPIWRHWVSGFGEYQLVWGADGTLEDVIADALIRNIIKRAAKDFRLRVH